MVDRKMKRARKEDEDLISKLPNDLIHQIMGYMDTRFAVQTCTLSKRWKLIWTTLPFLNFDCNEHRYKNISKFLYYFFCHRNPQSPIMKLKLCPGNGMSVSSIKNSVEHAILHNLECLHVKSDRFCSLSSFSSKMLKEINLTVKYIRVMEPHRFSLPSLKTLLLNCCNQGKWPKFPESIMTCFPALTTLGLNHFELPKIFSVPDLTTLRLESCSLPQQVWDFPALLNLELTNVVFPENMSDYFLALTSLQNLAIDFGRQNIGCCIVSSSQLLNLEIRVSVYTADLNKGKVVVLAPKLRNFNAIGFFLTRFEGFELENVNIKFWDCIDNTPSFSERKNNLTLLLMFVRNQTQFKIMLSQLSSTKILTLDLVTLQALSQISCVLDHFPCPFYNLKYLKIPHGYEESSMSRYVIRYLLSGSPSATIVRTLSRDDMTPQMEPPFSSITQNGVLEEPLETTIKEVVDYLYPHKLKYIDIVDMTVQKENPVENFVVQADKLSQAKAPVSETSNDMVACCEKSDFVLWKGHEVNSECVGMLDLIMKKYPQTFKKLPQKNAKILTVKLNTFCSSVNAFSKMSMAEVDTEMITEFTALFTDLQRWGFNTIWLMRHLFYIKCLHDLHTIDPRIDNAKSKLQELRNLGPEKTTDSECFGTMGTSHASTPCYIGDGLL